MYFDALKVKDEIIDWIKNWFENNGKGCNAVLGISGGKDSTIAAALCAHALGKDKVIGILMPNGIQKDIDDSWAVIDHIGIKSIELNIKEPFDALINNIKKCGIVISDQSILNLPPRLRMCSLYAVSQSSNGRVVNTSNLSESWIGYSTRYGDSAGDFAPLLDLTATEVKAVGHALELPKELVDKVPHDGLGTLSDEEKIGFSYGLLDKYIRTGICDDIEIKNKIDNMHKKNLFKTLPLSRYKLKSI